MAAISSDALVSSIQSEIQRVTNDLKGVDENLKRLTGRDFNEPRGERRIRLSSIGGREDEPPPKRRPPGGVFARLGEPVSDSHRGRRVHEVSEEEGEIPRHKPSVASSVARPIIDGKSRTEAAAELSKDKASRDRNRRMFGALLGTLQRFRTEEAKQKGKDEQRAKIEKKLEEKGRAEKEELQREKMDLISQRKERQARIRRLNIKIERVKEHEAWEEYQRRLGNFIRSQTKPRIFWIPKIIHPRTSQLLSDTKEVIERELEEERHRLKEELDEVLGGKLDVPMREEEGDEEEEERGREGEGNRMDFNNGSDLLDYDAEEGELVYEDDLLLPGKKQRERKRGERVVVQVESSVNKAPQRRVELVTVVADRSKRGREAEGNESEKENVLRSKISVESRSGKESGGEKGKGRVREKKNREKEDKKEKERNKGKEKKSHSEKETNTKSVPLKDSLAKRESKTSKKTRPRNDNESQKEKEEQSSVQASVTTEANEPEEEIWSEDLSHISLPLEPEPAVTEVVVQHVPMEGLTDDTTDTNGDVGEMQVETVLIDTSNIKKDKTVWEEALVHRPLVIKQEKDASPQQKEKEDAKAIEKPEKAQSEESESSSESSSDTEESSSEEEGTSFSNSSDDSSGSSSSSESEEEKEGKKKKGEKGKAVNKKEKSSSSESESSSDDDEDDDDDAKRTPSKKKPSGEKTSPKNSRKEEKGGERQGDRKREEKRKGVRSRSRERRSRSRSRERRRRRSRSRERRSRSRERSSKSREKRSRSRERRRDRSRSRERRRDRR